LTAEKVSDWIANLHARGVLPAPSERQLAEVARLFEKTGLSLDEAALMAELPGLASIRTRGEASAIIEVLRARLEEEFRALYLPNEVENIRPDTPLFWAPPPGRKSA
jgi:hypothetical protein